MNTCGLYFVTKILLPFKILLELFKQRRTGKKSKIVLAKKTNFSLSVKLWLTEDEFIIAVLQLYSD